MNEILTITLAFVVFTLFSIPLFICLQVFFPARILKAVETATKMPARSFLVGMVNFIFLAVMTFALMYLIDRLTGIWQGILILPALALLGLLGGGLSLGLAAISGMLGERLFPSQSVWQRALWGTLLLGLGSATPFVGWFLLFPYAAWLGMGALIISFFQK